MISTEPREESIVEEAQLKDAQILNYIWTVIEKYRERQEQQSIQCILCEEKLVHLTIIIQQRQPQLQIPFELGEELTNLVQKINKIAMENIREETQNSNAKFISKAVDLVMLPEAAQLVKQQTLIKLKILTFNNLACVLKKNKHYLTALKAVSFSLDLQEQMIKEKHQEEQYDIVATYLNKAAILSDMGKHGKALEQIRKARVYAERIEKDVEQQLKQCEDSELTGRLEEKKHYGQYMKMLINYSIGVEKEHQKLLSSAISYYQEGKRQAIMIENHFMANKIEGIILNLKKQ